MIKEGLILPENESLIYAKFHTAFKNNYDRMKNFILISFLLLWAGNPCALFGQNPRGEQSTNLSMKKMDGDLVYLDMIRNKFLSSEKAPIDSALFWHDINFFRKSIGIIGNEIGELEVAVYITSLNPDCIPDEYVKRVFEIKLDTVYSIGGIIHLKDLQRLNDIEEIIRVEASGYLRDEIDNAISISAIDEVPEIDKKKASRKKLRKPKK